MHTNSTAVRIGAVLVVLVLATSLISAEPPDQGQLGRESMDNTPEGVSPLAEVEGYHYLVKFVCGFQPISDPSKEPVKPGNYATAINIHNYTDHAVTIWKRPALHYTELDSEIPPIYPVRKFSIRPYRVLEIDCPVLWKLTDTKPGVFMKGMVDITIEEELSVVAVYTAAGAKDAASPVLESGVSIDVEYVRPLVVARPDPDDGDPR